MNDIKDALTESAEIIEDFRQNKHNGCLEQKRLGCQAWVLQQMIKAVNALQKLKSKQK